VGAVALRRLADFGHSRTGIVFNVGALGKQLVIRKLKRTSSELKRAEESLYIERQQLHSVADVAAGLEGVFLMDGTSGDRDEAFPARRDFDRAKQSVVDLERRVDELRARQDQLLDRLA
jgi:hypothetical protein